MGLNLIKNARQVSTKWKALVDTHLLWFAYQLNLHDVNVASDTYIIEEDVDLQLLTYDIWAQINGRGKSPFMLYPCKSSRRFAMVLITLSMVIWGVGIVMWRVKVTVTVSLRVTFFVSRCRYDV